MNQAVEGRFYLVDVEGPMDAVCLGMDGKARLVPNPPTFHRLFNRKLSRKGMTVIQPNEYEAIRGLPFHEATFLAQRKGTNDQYLIEFDDQGRPLKRLIESLSASQRYHFYSSFPALMPNSPIVFLPGLLLDFIPDGPLIRA